MNRPMVVFRGLIVLAISVLLLLTVVFFWGRQPLVNESQLVSTQEYRTPALFTSDTISIVSWNIGWLSGMTNNLPVPRSVEMYTYHLETARKVLSSLSPDILALQEIDIRSARTFNWQQVDSLAVMPWVAAGAIAINWNKRFVPFPYWPLGVQFGSMLSGQAILSAHSITTHQRHILKRPDLSRIRESFYIDRLAQVAVLQLTPHDSLAIINVHLEAWDAVTRKQQAQYVAALADSLRAHHVVLIAGDFNAMPPAMSKLFMPDSSLQFLLDKGFIPSGWTSNMTDEWPLTYSSEQPRVSIDHIFMDTSQLELLDSRVVAEMGIASDHLPLLARFVWKRKSRSPAAY